MKHCLSLVGIILLVIVSTSCNPPDQTAGFNGPYLGQTPPGKTPEIFAPGFISTGANEGVIVFTPAGTECFFTVGISVGNVIATTRLENGRWKEPEVAPFSGRYSDQTPFIHPDGSRLYYTSFRPLDGGPEPSQFTNIWFMEREGEGWGEPQPIGPPINGEWDACAPSVTRDGTMYFAKYLGGNGERLFRSRFIDGKYQEPELLPEIEGYAGHHAVSPDESFIILPVFGREDSFGSTDYYVSFRDNNDNWSPAINLGDPVNSEQVESSPFITADGKYFFFGGYPKPIEYSNEPMTHADIKKMYNNPGNGIQDIYWVDTEYIEQFRPDGYAATGEVNR